MPSSFFFLPVAFDLERPARARQFVAHLLEQSLERSVFRVDQAAAELVTGFVAASEKESKA
jgi:hypothetical protein